MNKITIWFLLLFSSCNFIETHEKKNELDEKTEESNRIINENRKKLEKQMEEMEKLKGPEEFTKSEIDLKNYDSTNLSVIVPINEKK